VNADMQWLLPLADAAVPFDHAGNQRWLRARQTFNDASALRRHYVVEASPGSLVGYGAIEQQDADPRRFRIYVVPERFGEGIEDLLFARLLQDLGQLDARVVWTREHRTDTSLLAFFRRCGLIETQLIWDMRFEGLMDHGSSHAGQPSPTSEQPVELTTLEHERHARPDALARLLDLCNSLMQRAQRPSIAESNFLDWLAQPALMPDAFVIVMQESAYIGLHALKHTEGEAVQEFAGLIEPALIPAAGSALRGWLSAYAQHSQHQGITAYVPAHDDALLALNQAIGYRRVFGYLTMEKRFDADR
jgi:hypothetical protein